MRRASVTYGAMAGLLLMSVLFDACIGEEADCTRDMSARVANATPALECRGRSDSEHCATESEMCCGPVKFTAIAPPQIPRLSADMQTDVLAVLPQIIDGAFVFEHLAYSPDGSIEPPVGRAIRPRQPRAPPPFAT